MSTETVIFLILGGLAGGFINGFAGTGTALFAMGFMLTVLEPKTAVAIIALVSVLSGIQGVWIVRHSVRGNLKRSARFVIPGVVGVPVGIYLLQFVDAQFLRMLIAGILLFYGAYFGFRRALPHFERHTPLLDSTIGLTGGVLGGLASISGALPAIWLSMRPWAKADTRAVLQPYNMATLGLTVFLLAWDGAYTRETWAAFAVALPAGLVAAQIGIFAFRRVSDSGFRRAQILLCLLMGALILLREFAGTF